MISQAVKLHSRLVVYVPVFEREARVKFSYYCIRVLLFERLSYDMNKRRE